MEEITLSQELFDRILVALIKNITLTHKIDVDVNNVHQVIEDNNKEVEKHFEAEDFYSIGIFNQIENDEINEPRFNAIVDTFLCIIAEAKQSGKIHDGDFKTTINHYIAILITPNTSIFDECVKVLLINYNETVVEASSRLNELEQSILIENIFKYEAIKYLKNITTITMEEGVKC